MTISANTGKNLLEIIPELKKRVIAVLYAKAWLETVKPIVTGYQKAILKELGAMDENGRPILNPEDAYLLDERMSDIYFTRCDEEAAKNNLVHKPECCPLLEAESFVRATRWELIDLVLPLLPGFEMITSDQLQTLSKTKEGKLKRDKSGRLVNKGDELVELILRFTVPQIPEDELKNL